MLDLSPNLFFIGSYSYFIDGPLLFLFLQALIYKDFALKKINALHALPLLSYFLLMVGTFYTLDFDLRHQLIETQHIAYSSPYLYFDLGGKLLRVGYVIACLLLLSHYKKQLLDIYANLRKRDISWLQVFAMSLLVLFSWDATLLIIKVHGLIVQDFNMDLLNVFGLSAYYLNFAVLNILIFLKFTQLSAVKEVEQNSTLETISDNTDNDVLERIEAGMRDPDIYAMPNITVDKLAQAFDLQPKKLSQLIKFHYKLNFYEFVNSHRINQAKQLLIDPNYSAKTITDIYYEVGFNSKSVFNTFFKRMTNMTPSQFRESNSANGKSEAALFK
jgi:AraC-like DNA-binding protein